MMIAPKFKAKAKRKRAADMPGMRYKRVISAIAAAERRIVSAQKSLVDLKRKRAYYERTLAARVDELRADQAASVDKRKAQGRARREARDALLAASQLAYRLGHRASLAPSSTFNLTIGLGPTAKRTTAGIFSKRKLRGVRVRMPGETQLCWVPGRGMAEIPERLGGLCIYSELKFVK
jgi:hypothetical protein